jgi:hypothetical protein
LGALSGPRFGSRAPPGTRLLWTSLSLVVLAAPAAAAAQLRPYEPLDWGAFETGTAFHGSAGGGAFWRQRASLAGTEGRLLEAGNLHLFFGTGRVVIEAAGTLQRFFDEKERFAQSFGGALPATNGRRRDSGDYLIGAAVRLTPPDRPAAAVLRFGTRLPTTNNREGLERDQTDFFATIGGRLEAGVIRASAEAGLGLHGTRFQDFEQSDVLVYAVTIEARFLPVRPALLLTGHVDGLQGWTVRGNEDLAEIRLRLRAGGRTWIQLEAVRGLETFSPAYGVRAAAGVTR